MERKRILYLLSAEERKAAHKWLMKQAKGDIPPPIQNMTLNKYFELVREAMLALCDEDGFDISHGGYNTPRNYKTATPLEAAKFTMDGRSLFHDAYGDKCGILGDIDPDDPVKFKWWVCNANWGGHPWETSFGNFVPMPIFKPEFDYKNTPGKRINGGIEITTDLSEYRSDNWLIFFSIPHRCDWLAMRCFIRLREMGLPVIWIGAHHGVLTKRYSVDLENEPDWDTYQSKQ